MFWLILDCNEADSFFDFMQGFTDILVDIWLFLRFTKG